MKENVDVVIIGAGITALSLAARLEQRGLSFVILERQPRIGGQIRTIQQQGYTFETGPNTGVVSTPEVMELFDYAAPYASIDVARKESASRWVWKGSRFHPLPSGLFSAITTPLFTWGDKLRVLLEPWRKQGDNPLESVGALAQRRLGKSFVDYAVDPFIGGIYAGDPYQLITQYSLPKLYNLEQSYGSFVRGAIAKSKEPKSERDKRATKKVFSAKGGLEQLVKAVAKQIQRTGLIFTEVSEIRTQEQPDQSWEVCYTHAGGEYKLTSKYLVTTVRADQLESVLPQGLLPLLPPIASLWYAPVTEVTVGFDHLPKVPHNAFGGLIPSREQRQVLGILFPSSCFAGRTPYSDSALFTIFMGGIRQGEKIKSMSDNAIKELALNELYEMLRIPKEIRPDLVELARHDRAIPQYDYSTQERLERLKEIHDAHPTLHIAGGISEGIGLAHRITQGARIGIMIADKLTMDK